MKPLDCRTISREALAAHLASGEISRTEAVSGASLYHCRHDRHNSLAIALDSGVCLIVENAPHSAPGSERRRKVRVA